MAETIKGLNIKLGLDTTELYHNLKEITAELKEEQKDLKAINNSLKFDASNVSLWKDKQEKLNSTLETTKKKLETQNARLEEAKKAVAIGAISEAEFNALKRSVQYTEADIAKLNKELETTREKIKSLGAINLDKLAKVGSTMTKYVTAPIIAAGTALTALTVKSMQGADAIADNADKIYLSIDAYQKWGHAFKILAVDETAMQKAFIKLNGILGDIVSGNGEKYNDYLNQLGLSTEDLIGLNPDQAFSLIRNSLSKLKDEILRVAIANEIFGDKLGSELAQVIKATTADIDNLKNEAEELGLVTKKQAEAAGKFTDSLDNLKLSMSNLGVLIGTAFVPILQKVVDTVQKKVVPAIRNVIGWWNNLSSGTKKIIGVLITVVASIGPLLVIVAKAIPLFGKLKSVLAIFKSGELLKGLTLGKLAIFGLIAALVVLLLKNEKFRDLLSRTIETLVKLLAPLGELISKLVTKLAPVFDTIAKLIDEIIGSLIELLNAVLQPIIDVLEVVIEVAAVLMEVLTDLIDEILPPIIALLKVFTDIFISLIPIVKVIINLIGDVLAKVLEFLLKVIEPIKKILKVVIVIIGTLINTIVKLVEDVLKPLNQILTVISSVVTLLADVFLVLIDIFLQILAPVLEIIIALLEPLLELIGVIIEAVVGTTDILVPLIDMILQPLIGQLDFIKYLLEAFSPLLNLIGEVIGAILAPALQLLFTLLKPILWVLQKIIDAIRWIVDNVAKAFEGIGNVFKKVGNFFGDLFTGKLFQNNANSTKNSYTTNNVTVNTSSSTFDINSINKALGGAY